MTIKQVLILSSLFLIIMIIAIVWVLNPKTKIDLNAELILPQHEHLEHEDEALKELHEASWELKSKTPEDTLEYFVLALKEQEYEIASSLISIEEYNNYFYTNDVTEEDIRSKINSFGETITRNNTIKDVFFKPKLNKLNEQEIELEIRYEDNEKRKYTLLMVKEKEFHEGIDYWYINTPVEEILEAFK